MKVLSSLAAGAIAAGLCLAALPASAASFTMWVRSDASNFMPALVKAFNKSHKDQVDLQIVPTAEMVQKYAVAAAGGNAPDALSLDLIYTPSFAAAGQLEDITDLAKSLPYLKNLSKAHLSVGTYQGKIYGMPFSSDASVLVWNKDLFKKAGLDPDKGPTTWAEWKSDAEKVHALGKDTYGFYFSGNCAGCNIFTFTPLVWANGGEILSKDGSKVTLDTPQMHDAINFYRSMIKEGLVPDGAQTDTGPNFFSAFARGNIGIAPLGAFAIGALNSQYPNLHYGVTFIPGKEKGWSSFAGGDNFVVSKGTKKLKEIKEFLEYTYSLEGQRLLAKLGSMPVRSDIADEALKGLDPRYAIAQKAMQNGKTPFSVVFNDIINSANGPWVQMINQVMFGPEDQVNDTIKTAQQNMESTIGSAQ